MNKLKILQINNCHFRRGGADVVYLNTGELFEKMGHEVVYFSQKSTRNYPSEYTKYFIDEVKFFELSLFDKIKNIPRFLYSKQASSNLSKLLDKEKPDIAHIHLFKGTLTSSILSQLKKKEIPVVLTLHDYGLLCPHNLFIDGAGKICEKCIGGSAINCIVNKCNRNNYAISTVSTIEYYFNDIFFNYKKYISQFIFVSKFAIKLHLNALPGIKNNSIQLYNFFPALDKTRTNPIKGKYFFYYSRLSKEKGAVTLLKAWSKVGRDIQLRIAGTGSEIDVLKRIKEEEKLDNVEFLGHIEGEKLNDNIKNASFILIPSEWYENNPLTVIESYAYGKPVIASRIGGLPEIITEGETGYLFEMGNIESLKSIIQRSSELSLEDYEIMSKNARKFAETNFEETSHYKKLNAIYTEVISSFGEKK